MARSLPNYVGKWGQRTKQAKSCFLPFGGMSEHLTCKITCLLIRTWGMAHISEFETHWFPYGKMMWILHDFTSWLWWLTPSISFIFVTFRDSLKKSWRSSWRAVLWSMRAMKQGPSAGQRSSPTWPDLRWSAPRKPWDEPFLSLGRWRCGSALTRCCSVVERVRDGTGVVGQNGPCQTAKTLFKTCVKTDGFVGAIDMHIRRTQMSHSRRQHQEVNKVIDVPVQATRKCLEDLKGVLQVLGTIWSTQAAGCGDM